MNIIECRGVMKKFGDFTALSPLSIDIPKGKIFGLLGPNGAGKTTLIRMLNQITMPDDGVVIFDGKPISIDDVLKIGYLPEERGLYKKMKVGEQSMYLARLKGMSSSEARVELKKWFIKFGIQGWWNKRVEELSKGMAQKVQFITTILHKPTLLILDEPFSGFDPINVQLIRNEILRMKDEGATIILSTHNMESVEALCDNIALLNKSKLVVIGAVEDIKREHGSNQVEVVYSEQEVADFSASKVFTVASDDEYKGARRVVLDVKLGTPLKKIFSELLNTTEAIISYRELVPSMNDIFIKLVSEEAN